MLWDGLGGGGLLVLRGECRWVMWNELYKYVYGKGLVFMALKREQKVQGNGRQWGLFVVLVLLLLICTNTEPLASSLKRTTTQDHESRIAENITMQRGHYIQVSRVIQETFGIRAQETAWEAQLKRSALENFIRTHPYASPRLS